MVKEILLTQGKVALVSDEDFDHLNQYNWFARRNQGIKRELYYAQGRKKGGNLLAMHRVIMGAIKGQIVDHINHDGLDNRRENLRFCTSAQNHQNSPPRANKGSKYKGVCWHNTHKIWRARIVVNGKRIYLGEHRIEENAAKAYNIAAKKHFGEFAFINILPELES